MHYCKTRSPLAVLLAVLLCSPATGVASPAVDFEFTLPDSGLSEELKIVHTLNRLAYGPRPGEVERVKAVGLEKWIAQQLAPETLTDKKLQKKLAGLDTLRMSQKDLMIAYPPPRLLRTIEQQLTTKAGMDPDSVTDIFPELEEMRERRRKRAQQQEGVPAENPMEAEGDSEQARPNRMQRARRGPNRILMELSQAKLLRAIYSERQLEEIMVDFWFNHFNVFIGKGTERWLTTGYERDAIRPHAMGNFRDLLGATARHPAMLFYLDNWQSADPEASQDLRALGRVYTQAAREAGLPRRGIATELLRQRGVEPEEIQRRTRQRQQGTRRRGRQRSRSQQGRRPQNRQEPFRAGPQRRRGLNENYARELLELHTLGVDGGYTQQDVIEVARCFTGWTLTPLAWGQQFVYADALHDTGEKTVLGKTIKNGGQRDGEQVLDMLVKHPATARFVATKLARRFVSDNPPGALVEKMAGTFLQTEGDLRAVLRTMFASEEFWVPEAINAKFKTPLEFLVSAVRATGAEVSTTTEDQTGETLRFVLVLRRLGQPLYGAPPPTGYKETADAWVSSGALLDRMKISLGLATGRLLGPDWGLPKDILEADSADQVAAGLGREVLGRELAPGTRQVLQNEVSRLLEARQNLKFSHLPLRARERIARLTLGWILASPEFQRQ
jgi:uncharacterized protein (DUF1800 family)